jgi:hypothetical protein
VKAAFSGALSSSKLRTLGIGKTSSTPKTSIVVDTDAALEAIDGEPPAERPQLYGDGHAAKRCVTAIGRLTEGSGQPS